MKLLQWLSLGIAALGIVITGVGAFAMNDTPYCSGSQMPVGSVCRDTDGAGTVVRERSYDQVRQTAANLRLIVVVTGLAVVVVGAVGAVLAVTRHSAPRHGRQRGGPGQPPGSAQRPSQGQQQGRAQPGPGHQPPGHQTPGHQTPGYPYGQPGAGPQLPHQPGWNAGPSTQPWQDKHQDATRIVPRDWQG